MGRGGIEQLLYLYDRAFEGGGCHNLLGNLKDVGAEDWTWTPPGCSRPSALPPHRPSTRSL